MPLTIEQEVAALSAANVALTTAVLARNADIANRDAAFSATTLRVAALVNVDNTSDTNKPISIAQASAISLKQNVLSLDNLKTVNGVSLIGQGNVLVSRGATTLNSTTYDTRATMRTTSAPLEDDTRVVINLGIFMFFSTQDLIDDDETCFNNGTGQWRLTAPAADLLAAWGEEEEAVADEYREDLETRLTLKGI